MTLVELEELVETTAVPMPPFGSFSERVGRECNVPPRVLMVDWSLAVVVWFALWSEHSALAEAAFDPREFKTEAETVTCIRRRKTEAMAVWGEA